MDISKITPNDTTYDIKDEVSEEDIEAIKTYIGYVPENVVGLLADFENSTFTRLGGAVGKSAGSDFNVFNMYGNRKVCALQDDGTVSKWYGEEGYVEDGSIGQIMVRQPKFYYKVVPLKLEPITNGEGYHLRKAAYYISDNPLPGFKVHPAFIGHDGTEKDCYYIGSYEASLWDESEQEYRKYDTWDVTDNGDDTYTINSLNAYLADATADKLCSIAGVKPASRERSTQFTRPYTELMAKNRGNSWTTYNIKMLSAEQLLFIIEYAAFNSQNILGKGGRSCSFTGSTSHIGNLSGMATQSKTINSSGTILVFDTDGELSIRYRGVENVWSNSESYINGITLYPNDTTPAGVIHVSNDFNYQDVWASNYKNVGITIFLGNQNSSYIKYFGYNDAFDWLFIPTSSGGNSSVPVGDTLRSNDQLRAYRNILHGGNDGRESKFGFFYYNMNTIRTQSGAYSSRLAYIE